MLFLHELLKDWPCLFEGEHLRIEIHGVTEHSGRVEPGFLFIARKGGREDGLAYIKEAVRLGAAAIVLDRELPQGVSVNIPLITVPNCLPFLAYVSARLAGNPSERMTVIAVTGTNGKTTVTHFIGQLLKSAGKKTAVIGTLGLFIDGQPIRYNMPKMTTLPAEYLHPLLKKCEAQKVTHIVMEASSLGLSMDRLSFCEMDVGVLLNVSEDHYDEHGSKAAYIQAKRKIIPMVNALIVNCDDPTCMEMVGETKNNVMYFGKADIADVQLCANKGKPCIKTVAGQYALTYQATEEFNRMNAIAAISTLSVLSFPYEKISRAVGRLTLPEGRMQRIDNEGVTVIIDYAHTPDALKLVLETIATTCSGDLIAVFGCGGNRDKGKRKKMGEVAGQYAKKVIITSDNPRDENPLQIIDEIVSGIHTTTTPYEIEVDREKAIQLAVTNAKKGDTIVIAGKGHEKTQEINNQILRFSDYEIVKGIWYDTI